jgi:hypothetical protein
MRSFRFAVALIVALLASASASEAHARRFWCRGPYVAPTFAYGNVGYAAGYSVATTRWGWGGGWCGPRWGGWCGPRWGWGCRPWAWGCNPGWGWGGWYGGTTYGCVDAVSLSVPIGGGATFFSGGFVPYPVCYPAYGGWGYPTTWLPFGYGAAYGGGVLPSAFLPQFGPAGVLPYLGVTASTANANAGAIVARTAAATSARPVIAAASQADGRSVAIRGSNGLARLRAARLVAVGDRNLREANGSRVKLTAALDAYQRAAAIAQDQSDTHVRQAITLVALGRQDQADQAVARAVAIDGRLGETQMSGPVAGLQANLTHDPVFGGRPAGTPDGFTVRGAAILREIGRQAGANDAAHDSVAWLADRWSQRWDRGLAALAANAALAR